jgi:Putative bacterial sensory transduction regulator
MPSFDLETATAALSEADTQLSDSPLDLIETVIASLDQDSSAMVTKDESGAHFWKFKYGSVEVFAQLTGVTSDDTLTIWSPILKLPVQNEAQLMRSLLEMNCGATFEACFGIANQEVVILASRILADINPGEVSRLMTVVATLADEQDEALQAQYPAA